MKFKKKKYIYISERRHDYTRANLYCHRKNYSNDIIESIGRLEYVCEKTQ